MKRYTFETGIDLFAIATDQNGLRYRILNASGRGAHYKMRPWDGTKITHYKGEYIKEDHPQFAEIQAANREALERNIAADRAKCPDREKRFERFAAQEI